MGRTTDVATAGVAADARRAYEAGHTVFTPVLNIASWPSGFSGGIDDWTVMIEAAEDCGWVLTAWSVAGDDKGRPLAYPFFRRRD